MNPKPGKITADFGPEMQFEITRRNEHQAEPLGLTDLLGFPERVQAIRPARSVADHQGIPFSAIND